MGLDAVRPHDQVCRPVHPFSGGGPDRENRPALADDSADQRQAEVGAVGGEHGSTEEQQHEPMQVAGADAVVDEDAVVIGLCDAVLADAAVLGAGGLEQLTGAAVGARVEQGEVEGVLGHLELVVRRRDVARVAGGGQPEEEVGPGDDGGDGELLGGGDEGPDARQVHVLPADEEDEEEYDDGGVSVVEHIVAEAQHGRGQPASGDLLVEPEEGAGEGVPEEAVHPCYWGVPEDYISIETRL